MSRFTLLRALLYMHTYSVSLYPASMFYIFLYNRQQGCISTSSHKSELKLISRQTEAKEKIKIARMMNIKDASKWVDAVQINNNDRSIS